MPLDIDIFGKGIYSPRQAARLIGGSAQEVLRWTRGSGPSEPLWKNHYSVLEDTTEVSFEDLIELRLVKGLRTAGISLQAIRFAIEFAKTTYKEEHPLATFGFKTDGDEVLMDAIEKDGELVSLSKKRPGQKVFKRLIEQSLKDLEYENDRVRRWRPYHSIVIDPDRQFGAPVLELSGISTKVLVQEASSGATKNYIAAIYELPVSEVTDAINYERRLDKKQTELDGQSTV